MPGNEDSSAGFDTHGARDRFLSLVAHELRTPLNAILGWARLLRTGALDAGGRARALETIERNALAQSRLIDEVLFVSRIVSGDVELDRRVVELALPVEAAIDAARAAAAAKKLHLEIALDRRLPPVSGDFERLQQIAASLLANAVRFTPEGGRIDVRLERDGAEARLVVADSGCGIAPDALAGLFDRFLRGEGPRGPGLGAGLAVVKHLVLLHGGSVHAESAGLDRGATFVVRLPLLADTVPAPIPAQPTLLDGVRVLVVDDEADARDLVKVWLEQAGATVHLAGSVPAALAEIERSVPDVLVSDIAMPGEDGYALMSRVRSLEGTRGGQVPAVALTAFARPADRMRTLAAGFQLHLAKPVDPGELAAVVARLAPASAVRGCARSS